MAVVIIVLVVGIVPWMAIILDLMVLACASFAWHFPPPFSLVEFHSTRLTLVIPYLQIYYFLAMSLYSKRRCLKIMPITSAYYEYESYVLLAVDHTWIISSRAPLKPESSKA